MKILVTGHRGCIGAHLVGLLKEGEHEVVGCDLDLFAGCAWEPMPQPDREIIPRCSLADGARSRRL
jgi:nucleoside-diphosphate-sugar epimerase